MSVRIEITQEDYEAYVKYLVRSLAVTSRDKVVRFCMFIAFGFGIGLYLGLTQLASHPTAAGGLGCGVMAGMFLVVALIGVFSRRQMRRMRPSEDGYMLGPQDIVLEENGITLKSSRHLASFEWCLVKSIGVTDKHYFIMVDRIAGIIVPQRAFTIDADRDQFVSELERQTRTSAARLQDAAK